MTLGLFIGCMTSVLVTSGQRPAPPVDTAEVRLAIHVIKTGIPHGPLASYEVHRLAAYHALLGEADSAFKFLNTPVEHSDEMLEVFQDQRFDNIREHAHWDHTMQGILERWQAQTPEGNIDYLLAIKEIFYKDQVLRAELEEIAITEGRDSEAFRKQAQAAYVQDSLNLWRLDALIDQYGWPTVAAVGAGQVSDVVTALLHAALSLKLKYAQEVEQAAALGEIPKVLLCYYRDKISIEQNGAQDYGTQVYWDKESGEIRLFPIEDAHDVDRRRSEMGLDSLHHYVNRMQESYSH